MRNAASLSSCPARNRSINWLSDHAPIAPQSRSFWISPSAAPETRIDIKLVPRLCPPLVSILPRGRIVLPLISRSSPNSFRNRRNSDPLPGLSRRVVSPVDRLSRGCRAQGRRERVRNGPGGRGLPGDPGTLPLRGAARRCWTIPHRAGVGSGDWVNATPTSRAGRSPSRRGVGSHTGSSQSPPPR